MRSASHQIRYPRGNVSLASGDLGKQGSQPNRLKVDMIDLSYGEWKRYELV